MTIRISLASAYVTCSDLFVLVLPFLPVVSACSFWTVLAVLSALLSADQGGLVALQTVPYSIWDNSTAKGRKLLTAAHDQLMAYHKNASIMLPPGTATRYPTQAIVALWDPSITWIGGGWSSMKVTTFESA